MTTIFKCFLAAGLLISTINGAAADERIYPVPTATIYAGDVIEASALTERTYPEGTRFRVTMVENPRALVGKIARRTLKVGEPVPMSSIEENRLVTRGVPTTIVFEEGALSITGIGMPQQNGTAGQMVQVKNMDSGRIVIGRVTEDGHIRVGTK